MEDLKSFCQRMPKVELHAHLNGSISKATIESLKQLHRSKDNSATNSDPYVFQPEDHSLSNCFNVFRLLHSLVTSKEAVFLSTLKVIEEFADDQVKYLELRSTPKRINGDPPLSKIDYIDSVLSAIKKARIDCPDIIVKFIISIDRSRSTEDALENIHLAIQYFKNEPDVVVGVDVSGNPEVADARDFIPALKLAKIAGLKISAHLSEIPNKNEETMAVLENICPDRIGHGIFLHTSMGGTEGMENFVLSKKLPLELCLTSNVSTRMVKSHEDHHFSIWRKLNHPLVICTDDKGLFDTSLSNEYYLFCQNFNLSKRELFNISLHSINHIFDGSSIDILNNIWSDFESEYLKI